MSDSGLLQSLLSGADQQDHLTELRVAATRRAEELGVPHRKDEQWRFTSLRALAALSPEPVNGAGDVDVAAVASTVPEAAAHLVFADGVLVGRQGDIAGITLASLDQAVAQNLPALAHLDRVNDIDADVFAAVNTSTMSDAAVVVVPAKTACSGPLHIAHVATAAAEGRALVPRVLVVAEDFAEITVVETHSTGAGLESSAYFVNAVTEVVVGRGATVRHTTVQEAGAASFIIRRTAVSIDRDGRYDNVSVSLGGATSRNNVAVVNLDSGTHAELRGLAVVDSNQLADTHSVLDHAKPHATSDQVHKCVAMGNGRAVFNGKIFVRQQAQKTYAEQMSRNLLLSNKAKVDAKPQLEIFADDVRCTHGATVGQLDEEQVFYLQTRGIEAKRARTLLTCAFAGEILENIPLESVRERLTTLVSERFETGVTEGS